MSHSFLFHRRYSAFFLFVFLFFFVGVTVQAATSIKEDGGHAEVAGCYGIWQNSPQCADNPNFILRDLCQVNNTRVSEQWDFFEVAGPETRLICGAYECCDRTGGSVHSLECQPWCENIGHTIGSCVDVQKQCFNELDPVGAPVLKDTGYCFCTGGLIGGTVSTVSVADGTAEPDECLGVQITVQNNAGSDIDAPAALAMDLYKNSITADFYATDDCAANMKITQTTFPKDQNGHTVYFKETDEDALGVIIQAHFRGLVRGEAVITIDDEGGVGGGA